METINLRLKRIGNHLIETTRVGIKNHNRHRDTLLAQNNTLVGKRHREITNAQALHKLRHLDIARAITMRLNHSHKTMIHRQMATEITYIMRHRIEIHLQHRCVATTLQTMAHALEMRTAITLQQNGTASNILVRQSTHKPLC